MLRTLANRAAVFTAVALTCTAGSVNAKDLVIGQSIGLTGGGAEVAKQYHQGAKCYFDLINADGGIRGNKIKLATLDDGGQRDKTLENTKKLINDEKVLALFGYTAAAGAQATFPLLEETGTPLVGIASGGLGIHDKTRRPVFHVRASYIHELEGAIDLLRSSGMAGPNSGFAFVYNQDAKANLAAFEDVAKRKGAKVVGAVGIDRNSTDMQGPVDLLLQAKPNVIIAITTAKAMGAIIREARKQGFTGTIVSSSFAGDPLAKEAGPAGVGTIVAHVVPDPVMRTTKVTSAYHTALGRCKITDPPNASGLEGYVTARVLVEGLRRAGNNPTSESLIKGMEGIKQLDLGGLEVGYAPDDRAGSRFVEFLIVTRDGKLKK